MHFIGLFALALLPVYLTAANASAGSDARAVVQHIFEMADENRDGSLDRSEYEAAGLQRYGVTFEQSDANADGETTMEEYLELYERHHPPADRTGT